MTVNPPYGDAFLYNTPNIDRMTQQLFLEQRNRKIARQRQAEAMDAEFSKNVANVRDVDIDDITKAYGDWKLLNQGLMKQKGGIKPQDQLELLRKKAEVSKKIAASKSGKQEEEDWAKMIGNKPEDYEENAYDLLTKRRRTPIGQVGQYTEVGPDGKEVVTNLADLNTYRYKGTDFNFQEAEKKAAGDLKDVLGDEALEADGFNFKTPVYQFGSTPAQYKDSLVGALATRKGGDAAERLMAKISPEVEEQVDAAYAAIPKEKLSRMGLKEPQQIKLTNPENAAERYAAHMAKLYAINAEPKEGKPVMRRNEPAFLKAQEDKEKRMANLRHGLAVALKKTPGAKAEGSEDDGLYLEEYLDTATDKALTSGIESKGDVLRGGEYAMDVDPVIAKAFTRQGIEPEIITVNKNGEYTPIYYEYKKDGTKSIIGELSKPMSRTQALIALGVKATTGKQRYKEGESAVKPAKTKQKVYKGLDKNGNPIFE